MIKTQIKIAMFPNAGRDTISVIINLLIPLAALTARNILKTRNTRTIRTRLADKLIFWASSRPIPMTEIMQIRKSKTLKGSMK